MAHNMTKSPPIKPLILTVPGLNNSGPGHWQTLWEERRDDCQRVELGMWDKPHRNTWVNQLNLAIHAADRPVILVAHSLGCLAVAWWAQLEGPALTDKVRGALLVAPPEVDHRLDDARVAGFAPPPGSRCRFPRFWWAATMITTWGSGRSNPSRTSGAVPLPMPGGWGTSTLIPALTTGPSASSCWSN